MANDTPQCFYRPHDRVQFKQSKPSLTKVAPQEETDLNAIMRKYGTTGSIPVRANPGEPLYGDFTSALDYQSALTAIREADAIFGALPSKVRDQVENDPAKLLDLVFDPEREEEARELGLVPGGVQPTVEEDGQTVIPGAEKPSSTESPAVETPEAPESE